MAIEVKIQRKRNTFELNIDFKSDSNESESSAHPDVERA